jgi:hypothetical protein
MKDNEFGIHRIGQIFTTVAMLVAGQFGNLSTAAAQTPYLKQGASPVGIVLVSEHTGAIYACAATTSVTASSSPPFDSVIPIGKCEGIGAIPATSLSGNSFVSMSFNGTYNDGTIGVGIPYGVAFVGNLATGYVVQCTYQYVPATNAGPTGQIFGSCVPAANPAR